MDKTVYSKSKYHVRYTESFKEQACRQFLTGHYSKDYIQRKYNIKGKSRLLTWLREYKYLVPDKNGLTMPDINEPNPGINNTPEQKKIRELEKALQDAEMKAEAYWRMIRIAEEEFKIPIRKKSPTKPSEK